jgi:hypothetical protein
MSKSYISMRYFKCCLAMEWHREPLKTEREELVEHLRNLRLDLVKLQSIVDQGWGDQRHRLHYNSYGQPFTAREQIRLVAGEITKAERELRDMDRGHGRDMCESFRRERGYDDLY